MMIKPPMPTALRFFAVFLSTPENVKARSLGTWSAFSPKEAAEKAWEAELDARVRCGNVVFDEFRPPVPSNIHVELEAGVEASDADLRAFERGRHDAERGRGSIFRRRRGGIVPTIDDAQADDWSDLEREAYLAGYDTVDEQLVVGEDEGDDEPPPGTLFSTCGTEA